MVASLGAKGVLRVPVLCVLPAKNLRFHRFGDLRSTSVIISINLKTFSEASPLITSLSLCASWS